MGATRSRAPRNCFAKATSGILADGDAVAVAVAVAAAMVFTRDLTRSLVCKVFLSGCLALALYLSPGLLRHVPGRFGFLFPFFFFFGALADMVVRHTIWGAVSDKSGS